MVYENSNVLFMGTTMVYLGIMTWYNARISLIQTMQQITKTREAKDRNGLVIQPGDTVTVNTTEGVVDAIVLPDGFLTDGKRTGANIEVLSGTRAGQKLVAEVIYLEKKTAEVAIATPKNPMVSEAVLTAFISGGVTIGAAIGGAFLGLAIGIFRCLTNLPKPGKRFVPPPQRPYYMPSNPPAMNAPGRVNFNGPVTVNGDLHIH